MLQIQMRLLVSSHINIQRRKSIIVMALTAGFMVFGAIIIKERNQHPYYYQRHLRYRTSIR